MRTRHTILLLALFAAFALAADKSDDSSSLASGVPNACDQNINELDPQKQCQLAHDCPDLSLGRINFLKMYYCGSKVLTLTALVICLFVSFFGLGLTASEFLTPNLHFVSKFLNLSDNLAGLTLVAMGNSSPDILSNYKAMKLGHADLAFSELVGACFFITSIVVGTMSILHPFKIPKKLFIRDAVCLLLVGLITLFTLVLGRLNFVICFAFIVCYISYVVYVVVTHSISKEKYMQRMRDNTIRSNFISSSVNGVDEEDSHFSSEGLPQLPSIEDLNLSNPHDEDYHQELDDELDQFRLTIGDDVDLSNTYAIKQLISELAQHKKFSIHLNNERSLGITMSETTNSDDSYKPPEFEDDNRSYWARILDLNSAPVHPIYRIRYYVTLPVRVLLKLTVPVSRTSDDPKRDVDPIQIACMMVFLNLQLHSTLAKFFIINLPLTALMSWVLVQYNYHIIYSFFGFTSAVLWISSFATEVINVLKTYSVIYQISDVILGFTVFAVGNCIGDFIANFTIARLGMPIMAFGACFGSPILALSFMGINGLSVLLDDQKKNFVDSAGYIIGHSSSMVILNLGLILNLVLIFVLARRYDWNMNEKVGYALIGNWLLINSVCILIELV